MAGVGGGDLEIPGACTRQAEFRPDGTVADPNIMEAEPPRIFNTSALRAILRWKFKPRIVDGKPVPRRGVQVIEFKLEENV